MEETKNTIIENREDEFTPMLGLYDTETPIVVLFGPMGSGKKMVLFSLVNFFERIGLVAIPVCTLLPNTDIEYTSACKHFKEMAHSEFTDDSGNLGFILVNVFKNGHKICQILVIPGQYCFDPGRNPNIPSVYVNQIRCCPNLKIWIPFIEADWGTPIIQSQYIEQIQNLKRFSPQQDKFIILANKIDRLNSVFHGPIDSKSIKKYFSLEYQGLFNMFKNEHPITRLFKPYNCEFVPFSSGVFSILNGKEIWHKGDPLYAKMLWEAIIKCIK